MRGRFDCISVENCYDFIGSKVKGSSALPIFRQQFIWIKKANSASKWHIDHPETVATRLHIVLHLLLNYVFQWTTLIFVVLHHRASRKIKLISSSPLTFKVLSFSPILETSIWSSFSLLFLIPPAALAQVLTLSYLLIPSTAEIQLEANYIGPTLSLWWRWTYS